MSDGVGTWKIGKSASSPAATAAKPVLAGSAQQESVIGTDCVVHGTIEGEGAFRIDGRLEGDINIDGSVLVGEEGRVRASIKSDTAKIFGQVKGDICCKQRIELHAGAEVRGNLQSPRVVIQDGVLFEGRCSQQVDRSDPDFSAMKAIDEKAVDDGSEARG